MLIYQHQDDHQGFRRFLFLIRNNEYSPASVDHTLIARIDTFRVDNKWCITGRETLIYKCKD